MTDGFKVGTGLKQGEGRAHKLFNIALEYVIRKLSVQTTSTVFHKSVQGPQNTTRLQKHTHPQPHTTHNIGIALTTRYIH